MPTIHPDFRCQGSAFESAEKLCAFVRKIDEDSAAFLSDWFNDESYVLVNTSGSTGTPKQIRLFKTHMVNSAMSTGRFFKLGTGTNALLCLSANFIAGKMMWVRALTLGWQLDIADNFSTPLEGNQKQYDFSAMVPMQVQQSLPELNNLKKLIVGGGAVSKNLRNSLQHVSTAIYATYGMTETITHIAVCKLNHLNNQESENYQALASVKLSRDDRGCLVIEAPLVSDVPVVTNDLVELHSASSFRWLGRYDSIVNSGGVKLIPETIEGKIGKVLTSRFMLCGIPDEQLGEKLVLLVEGEQENLFEKEAILKLLNGVPFGKYEVPKAVYFVRNFVLTETGKVQRNKTMEAVAF